MKLVTVIDGDTYVAVNRRGRRLRLRLKNADCPELDQPDGPLAKHFVHRFISKKSAAVKLVGRDRHGRMLAHIRIEGADLALALVKEGLAYPSGRGWGLRMAGWLARVQRVGAHARPGAVLPREHRRRYRWWKAWARLNRQKGR